MSIKRVWFLTLGLVAIISVLLSVLVLSKLTDASFNRYLDESHEAHLNQIMTYTKSALENSSISYVQMRMEYEAHLSDPIVGIKLYTPSGKLLVAVENEKPLIGKTHGMMSDMMGLKATEVSRYNIKSGDAVIGILLVSQNSSASETIVARLFKRTLLINGLIAMVFALGMATFIAEFVSSRMSRGLHETAIMAEQIENNLHNDLKKTGVKEIALIREKLSWLSQRLKLKQKMRKEAVDQIIHETRTPLTILSTHIEAMSDGVVEASTQEFSLCLAQVQSLQKTIESINDMIVEEDYEETYQKSKFSLNELIREVASGLKLQFERKSLSFELTLPSGLSQDGERIESDKHKLEKVFFNLLTNAYKYTPEGGRVSIQVSADEDRFIVAVEDNGIGMTPEEMARIFEPYYRAAGVFHISGEGIGLYFVQKTLQNLGGSVSVSSAVSRGSTFTVILPRK